MGEYDGEAGAVENVKNEHYAAMPKSWEARNNKEMNEKMGYNAMQDLANTPHPATKMEGAKNNRQLGPEAADNEYNYNADR
jgi:hypothetical protein